MHTERDASRTALACEDQRNGTVWTVVHPHLKRNNQADLSSVPDCLFSALASVPATVNLVLLASAASYGVHAACMPIIACQRGRMTALAPALHQPCTAHCAKCEL